MSSNTLSEMNLENIVTESVKLSSNIESAKAESNLRKCKKCRKYKKATLAGYWSKENTKCKKWLSPETNKPWNGKLCPECNSIRVKVAMKKMRVLRTSNEKINILPEDLNSKVGK